MLELTSAQLAGVIFVSYGTGILVCAFFAWLFTRSEEK